MTCSATPILTYFWPMTGSNEMIWVGDRGSSPNTGSRATEWHVPDSTDKGSPRRPDPDRATLPAIAKLAGWNDRRIVSEGWIQESTRARIDVLYPHR